MKKYLLTLCLTMLGFVASWAQDYRINISGSPIYVDVNEAEVTDPGFPSSREFTIDVPIKTYGETPVYYEFGTDYTVEAVVANTNLVTASNVSYNSETKSCSVSFTKATGATIGKTDFQIVVKESGQEKAKTGSIDIYVFDKDNVNQLVAPANLTIGATQKEEVPFYFAPVTATLTVTAAAKTGATNTGTLKVDKKKNTNGQWVIELDAEEAVNGDKYTVTITPQKGVDPVSFDVDVTLPVFPVKYQSTYRTFYVGDKLTSPLEVEVPDGESWVKGTNYKVEYSATGVTEGYISITKKGSEKDVLNLLKAGKAQVTATYTPQGDLANRYSTWQQTLDINILPAYYQYNGFDVSAKDANNTYTVTPGEVRMTSLGTSGHITVNPDDYDIHYYLEGEIPGSVEIVKDADGNIIFDQNGKFQVKVTDPVPSQTFYVMATVTPKDRTNYNGVTARQEIKFAGTQTGAILKKVAEGEWVAYLANPNETGEGKEAVYTIDGATTAEQTAAGLAEFKNATNIKVMGVVCSHDITHLARAIGSDYNSVTASTPLKTLDFSGCTLVGGFAVDANGSYNGLPIARDDSESGYFHSFTNVETLILPKPASPNTTLPKDFWKFFSSPYNPQENNLKSLTIPEGWTEVAEGFGCSMEQGNNTALKSLKQLVLANSIEKIGKRAFSGLGVEVLTMPKNIHRIAEYAFAPSPKLQDVYFTGPAPEYVDIFAFDGETQQTNNTVHDDGIMNTYDPVITRFEYWDNAKSQQVLVCIMHYPKEYQSTYIDETREYKKVPANIKYHPGNNDGNLYTPDGWTDEFVNNVRKGKQWHSAQMISPVNCGVKDKYYGESMIWPSQLQMSSGYCVAQAGYQWNGQPLRQADQYQPGAAYDNEMIDRRGLYQFIIAMNNGTSDIVFEADKWYTICLPFNMDKQQIKDAFGDDTQVCRFSKVTRDVTSEQKTIKLYFRKSVMGDQTKDDLNGTDYSKYEDEGHGETYAAEYKKSYNEGIIHHFPYMIKPSGPTSEKYSWHDAEGKWHFDSSLFKEVLSGVLHAENVYANNSKSDIKYSFVPIMMDNSGNNNVGGIKPNSYIFVKYPTGDGTYKHQYVFYKGVKKDGVYVAGSKANQNTAYVQMSATDGQADCDEFFSTETNKGNQLNAKAIKSFFGDEEDDDATEIEKVVIICGDDPEPELDNKVYTINGVLVNGNNLPAGLYIKNGKKFIVK